MTGWERLRRSRTGLVGGLLIVELLVLVYVLFAVWPQTALVPELGDAAAAAPPAAADVIAPPPAEPAARTALPPVRLFWATWDDPSPDLLYLVAVAVLGALGASVHAFTSFATFVGNRTFRPSWTWWYLMRLPVGGMVAVVFYLLLRGGLLSVGTGSDAVNPYGIGAIAALSGMFSKQAVDKLSETFTTLFRTESDGDQARKDKMHGGKLRVDRLAPDSVPVGTPRLAVAAVGDGFGPTTTASVGEAARTVTVASPTECTVTLVPEDVAAPGPVTVALAAGDETASAVLRVRPRIDNLVGTDAGDPTLVRVEGAGFAADATVTVGGEEREVVGPADGGLVVRLLEDDVAAPPGVALAVVNPEDAGGASDPVPLSSITAAG